MIDRQKLKDAFNNGDNLYIRQAAREFLKVTDPNFIPSLDMVEAVNDCTDVEHVWQAMAGELCK